MDHVDEERHLLFLLKVGQERGWRSEDGGGAARMRRANEQDQYE
jgi:hypothetical protein